MEENNIIVINKQIDLYLIKKYISNGLKKEK
jgi:hypothetical protein